MNEAKRDARALAAAFGCHTKEGRNAFIEGRGVNLVEAFESHRPDAAGPRPHSMKFASVMHNEAGRLMGSVMRAPDGQHYFEQGGAIVSGPLGADLREAIRQVAEGETGTAKSFAPKDSGKKLASCVGCGNRTAAKYCGACGAQMPVPGKPKDGQAEASRPDSGGNVVLREGEYEDTLNRMASFFCGEGVDRKKARKAFVNGRQAA